MKAINLHDGTTRYLSNPGYCAPRAFEDGSRRKPLRVGAQTQMQRPGEVLGQQGAEQLHPGTESEPTSLPDQAPAVEPDVDGNRSALDAKRAQASSRPM